MFTIYLQHLASIPPRTSLVKFARSPRTDPPGVRNGASRHRGLRSTQREEGPKQANVGSPACGDQLSVEGCDWRGGKRGCDERTRSATRQGPHKGVQRRRLHAKFSLTLS